MRMVKKFAPLIFFNLLYGILSAIILFALIRIDKISVTHLKDDTLPLDKDAQFVSRTYWQWERTHYAPMFAVQKLAFWLSFYFVKRALGEEFRDPRLYTVQTNED